MSGELLQALVTLLSVQHLLFLLVGVMLGLMVGILPGLGAPGGLLQSVFELPWPLN